MSSRWPLRAASVAPRTAHPHVVVDGAAEEHVVPPAPVERGHVDVGVGIGDADALPVVVELRMGQPVVVVGSQPALQVRHFLQGQVQVSVGQIVLGVNDVVQLLLGEAQTLGEVAPVGGGQGADGPGKVEAKLEGAALPGPTFVVVGGGDAGDDGRQRWGLCLGREPLGCAHVGHAVHAHLAGAPGLGRHPLHGVVAVVGFVDEGVELAV